MRLSDVANKLKQGESVTFKPSGNSMDPKIKNKQKVTVSPINHLLDEVKIGDVVLCKVNGVYLLHLVTAIISNKNDGSLYQISNNHGHVNGLINESKIYGIVTEKF